MRGRTRIIPLLWTFALSLQSHSQTAAANNASPDTGIRRFELGLNLADIRTGCIGNRGCALPSFGLGVSGAYNLTPRFAIEANAFDTPATSNGPTNISGGHAAEFLLGVRAEIRAKHYGYFVKAQPGFFRWSKIITGASYTPPSALTFNYGSRTELASAIGAGFEYSPSPRIHLRGEVSDLLLRFGAGSWTNNLQPAVGVYVSTGRPIAWTAPVYQADKAHRFLDRANLALITASVLGITADSVTTHDFTDLGIREGDPIARPFVKYGWPGQISLELLETSAEVAAMYGLHRIHHHRAERIVPVSLAAIHAAFAYNNSTLQTPPR